MWPPCGCLGCLGVSLTCAQYAAELPIGTRVFVLRSRQQHYSLDDIFVVSAVVSKYRRESDPWEYNENGSIAGLEVVRAGQPSYVLLEDVRAVPRWFNAERRDLENVGVDDEIDTGRVEALAYTTHGWCALIRIDVWEREVNEQSLYVPLKRGD